MKILFPLIIFYILSGCSQNDLREEDSPGPTVEIEQAQEVARNIYGVVNIETSELRLLTESELENLNDEQLMLTPVYYIFTGLVDNEQVKVFVSSNEVNHHFVTKGENN